MSKLQPKEGEKKGRDLVKLQGLEEGERKGRDLGKLEGLEEGMKNGLEFGELRGVDKGRRRPSPPPSSPSNLTIPASKSSWT